MAQDRICSGCTACCKTHYILEARSLPGELCKCCAIDEGCLIFEGEQRPTTCHLYECLWLNGKGEESDRPDGLKIVMDGTIVNVGDRQIDVVNIWEVEEGAALQARVQQITEALLMQRFAVRHRKTVSLTVSKLRIMDEYFTPNWMFTKPELQLFLEAMKDK